MAPLHADLPILAKLSTPARPSASARLARSPAVLCPKQKSLRRAGLGEDLKMHTEPVPPPNEPEAYYKVERQLRAMFPRALKPQRAGASIDVRVYFREKPDGSLWGGLALLGEDGRIVDKMPLADPPSLPWLLNIMCELGFDAAPRVRTTPRGAASDG